MQGLVNQVNTKMCSILLSALKNENGFKWNKMSSEMNISSAIW